MPPNPKNWELKIDSFVKSQKTSFSVIPAEAGIQYFQRLTTDLDPGFRRGDDFLRDCHYLGLKHYDT